MSDTKQQPKSVPKDVWDRFTIIHKNEIDRLKKMGVKYIISDNCLQSKPCQHFVMDLTTNQQKRTVMSGIDILQLCIQYQIPVGKHFEYYRSEEFLKWQAAISGNFTKSSGTSGGANVGSGGSGGGGSNSTPVLEVGKTSGDTTVKQGQQPSASASDADKLATEIFGGGTAAVVNKINGNHNTGYSAGGEINM